MIMRRQMTRAVLAAVTLGSLALSAPARADIGTVDAVPAATLLLPFFEVDLGNPAGVTTLFSINNASATAALAHVTVWSDLSVPTLAFNVYLTGYDVQTINVRDLMNAVLPRTASAGQDPGDTTDPNTGISNKGPFSQDINFASCTGQLPLPPLDPGYAPHMQAAHQGLPSPFLQNRCAGQRLNDGIARGYITVDTVNNCTLRVAGDAGYFGPGGSGDATNQNILWGDYFYVNSAQNFAQGDTLVHIEASATNPETSVPGEYTFYGRYVAWTAADNREPLATSFGTRFLNGGAFSGGTSYLAWRDPKVNQAPFTCPAIPGSRPSWYPLGQEGVMVFDEQENPDITLPAPVFPPPPVPAFAPFPAAASRAKVDGPELPIAFDFGWMFLNLNTFVSAAGSNPPEDPGAAQAWVTQTHDAEGRFSVGYAGVQMDNATNASHFTPGF
jgi:hypothetical protein